MDNVQLKIEEFSKKLEAAKTAKTKAETNLETLEKQKEEILKSMEAEGVTPDTIDAEIEKLEQEIQKNLVEAEKIIKEFEGVI